MNRERRREIRNIQKEMVAHVERLQGLAEEEDEYRDNMPENLMFSERYDESNNASDTLYAIADEVQQLSDQLEEIM